MRGTDDKNCDWHGKVTIQLTTQISLNWMGDSTSDSIKLRHDLGPNSLQRLSADNMMTSLAEKELMAWLFV